MREKLISVTIVASLALVGGGCFNKTVKPEVIPAGNQPSVGTEAIPEDIDSAVADIIKTIDNEIGADEEAGDVSALNEGDADLSDFYDSTYEIE